MQNTPDILKRILKRKVEEVAKRQSDISMKEIISRAGDTPAPRPFYNAITESIGAGKAAVIAEIKKASPSRGVIRSRFDPAKIAVSFERGGATCLSVVTDMDFFHGSDEYLRQAKAACTLPVLRKDFVIQAYQVYEARVIGADCILLIAAALNDAQLFELTDLASQLGLDVLVEVHNREELERAHVLRTPLIGINNRDLHNFETSLDVTLRLVTDVYPDRIIISESGIHSREDIKSLRKNGVDAFLVGEALMSADNPGVRLQELFFS